jgi:methylmalonyl-CoA/ethylmalonyl-CoA epimerase
MMQSFGLRFHHLGLACRQKDRAERFLVGLGYSIGEWTHDPLQDVLLCMCLSQHMPDVEIVVPTNISGPLDNMLKNVDALTYHCCFETSHLDASLNAIKLGGHRIVCISDPKPAALFDGRRVSFYMVGGFGLVELLETA